MVVLGKGPRGHAEGDGPIRHHPGGAVAGEASSSAGPRINTYARKTCDSDHLGVYCTRPCPESRARTAGTQGFGYKDVSSHLATDWRVSPPLFATAPEGARAAAPGGDDECVADGGDQRGCLMPSRQWAPEQIGGISTALWAGSDQKLFLVSSHTAWGGSWHQSLLMSALSRHSVRSAESAGTPANKEKKGCSSWRRTR